MLNNLRSGGSNAFVWVILFLLIIGLAGFGTGGLGGGGASTPVASVGETSVTVDDYVRAYNQENRQVSAQFGRALTPQEMQMFGLDQRIISQLLNGAALDDEASRLGFSVGDETVRERLMRIQAFRGIDGQFDQAAYEFALEQTNLDPAEYDDIVRSETTRQLVQASIMSGVSTPETAAEAIVAFLGQKRAVNWVRLNATHLDAPVGEPTDTQLAEYYTANEADYTLPETRTVTYAAITEEQLAANMDVDESEIRAIYDDRIDEFRAPARRLLDRIVFGDNAQAEAAKAAIDAGTSGFEDIAEERNLETDDIDLGEVVAEDLNAAERDLVFNAEDLGIYGPVDSEFGPALYRINAILDETIVTFDEAKEELRTEAALENAANEIADALEEIENLLAGGATLEELANETILELVTASVTAESEDGLAADEAFRAEAFSADVGEERDPIDLNDGVAVLRVDAITEPTLQPISDVRFEVSEAWRLAETQTQITALGDVLKGRIEGGENIGDVAATYSLILNEEEPLGRNGIIEDTPPEFVASVFEAEVNDVVVVPDNGSVLIGQLTQIVPEDMRSDAVKEPIALFTRELDGATANDVFAYFTQGLQDEAGVTVNTSLIASVLSQLHGGN